MVTDEQRTLPLGFHGGEGAVDKVVERVERSSLILRVKHRARDHLDDDDDKNNITILR